MHHLKEFVVGAAVVFLAEKIGSMDAVQGTLGKMSPTLAGYAPVIVGGGLFVVAKKYMH